MIAQLVKLLWRITNRDRIPRLPRAMYAERYTDMDSLTSRVMARLGARSPKSVKIAMRRHRVKTPEELIELLDHYIPSHRFQRRLNAMLARIVGARLYHPYARQINDEWRAARRKSYDPALTARYLETVKTFRRQS